MKEKHFSKAVHSLQYEFCLIEYIEAYIWLQRECLVILTFGSLAILQYSIFIIVSSIKIGSISVAADKDAHIIYYI